LLKVKRLADMSFTRLYEYFDTVGTSRIMEFEMLIEKDEQVEGSDAG